ncbi:unnamed protein product [Closterium sp. NIES-53]
MARGSEGDGEGEGGDGEGEGEVEGEGEGEGEEEDEEDEEDKEESVEEEESFPEEALASGGVTGGREGRNVWEERGCRGSGERESLQKRPVSSGALKQEKAVRVRSKVCAVPRSTILDCVRAGPHLLNTPTFHTPATGCCRVRESGDGDGGWEGGWERWGVWEWGNEKNNGKSSK